MTQPILSSLPGYAQAAAYLADQINPARDISIMFEHFDRACMPPKSTLIAEALDMLLILQLYASFAQCQISNIPLKPAQIQLLRVPESRSAKRLKALLKQNSTGLIERSSTMTAKLYHQKHDEFSRHFEEDLEDALLAARPVVLLQTPDQSLSPGLAQYVENRFDILPPSPLMVAAVLQILHKCDIAPADYPAGTRAEFSEVSLVRVLGTEDLAIALSELKRLSAGIPAPRSDRLTLDKVHGQEQAKAALAQLCRDLTDWRNGQVAWEDVTSSFLLYGPPGTGKTLLASALGGSAGLPVVKTSYSDCQKNGHQGDMLRALHARADAAIAQAPSIFFIDEIDSFYARDMYASSKNAGYITGVVNGLLTLLDKINAVPGMVVMAATNHRSMVDPAVIRDGRFDTHIPVTPLDRDGVKSYLAEALPDGFLSPAQLGRLCDQLSGQVGAKLANLVRSAKTRARNERRALCAEDLIATADVLAPAPSAAMMRRIAYHEAGHILIGHLYGLPQPDSVEIQATGGFVRRAEPRLLTDTILGKLIATALAGYAAEALVFGAPSHGSGGSAPENDLAQATSYAMMAELCYGFGATLTWQRPPEGLAALSTHMQSRIDTRLQQGRTKAHKLLKAHSAALTRIATRLGHERKLTGADLAEMLCDIPQDTPGSDGLGQDAPRAETMLSSQPAQQQPGVS
jgi:cell division protease FtsH